MPPVVNLAALNRLTDAEASLFGYGTLSSNGSNIQLINNGHTVQVKLPTDYQPDATVVYKGKHVTAYNALWCDADTSSRSSAASNVLGCACWNVSATTW